MAVAHGYGKIAGTDALTFAYDTGDAINSYRGEPTTNIIADPLYRLGVKNAYYDTNNTGWGTITRGKIEEVMGPFGKPVQAYSQELISYNSGNRSIEGQPQEVVNNVNCLVNLTAGVTYRISVWIKATYTGTSQNRLYISGTAAVGDGNNRQVTTEWQRISRTYTPSTSGNYYMRHYDYSSGKEVGAKIWYALPQVEVDKGHDTQFIEGTRSTTQSLLDLTGNSTINLSNISFNNNAQPTWDGTDDYIDTTKTASDLGIYDSEYTLEAVFKLTVTTANDNMVFGTNQTSLRQGMHNGVRNGTIYFGHYASDYAAGSVGLNEIVHVAWVYDGTTAFIYKNGILQGSGNILSFIGTTNIWVGRHWGYFAGDIYLAKIHNRSLTSLEVANNYRHYKTRFNLP